MGSLLQEGMIKRPAFTVVFLLKTGRCLSSAGTLQMETEMFLTANALNSL